MDEGEREGRRGGIDIGRGCVESKREKEGKGEGGVKRGSCTMTAENGREEKGMEGRRGKGGEGREGCKGEGGKGRRGYGCPAEG